MSTTTTSTSPTDIGQALINAFNNPTGNLIRSLLLTDEDGSITSKKGTRFILQSYGYLDLRVSLVAGLTFPKDSPSFEALYPKASLQSLNSFDPLLYQETETAMLDFWNACNDVNQYALSSFWTVFSETQMLCQALIDQLTGAGEVSLQGMISMLTSQTYSQPGSENDSKFKGLAQSASEMLLNLSQLANQRASSIQGLAASIASQASKIQATTAEIDAVVKKFGLHSEDHYITTIDFKLAMIQTVLSDRIPVAGWISGSNVILTEQSDVGMAWTGYQAHIANKSTDANKTAYTLVGAVNLLSLQNQAICDRLRSAGVALQEIQSTFTMMGNNLGQAASLMAAADGSVRTSLIANQQAIQAGITKAVKEFQDALYTVQALITVDSDIQTSGITTDIAAPTVFSE